MTYGQQRMAQRGGILPPVMAACTYTSRVDGYQCPLEPRYGRGLCILHQHGDVPAKDPQAFLEALRGKIRRDLEDPGAKAVRLDGVVFPVRLVWRDVVEGLPPLEKPLDFSGATFTEAAYFSEAAFTQDANFNGVTFAQDADFFRATFAQNADFWKATFTRNGSFTEATFTGLGNFRGATFAEDADFSEVSFAKGAHFFGAVFVGHTGFFGVTFSGSAAFSGVTFSGYAGFLEATFSGYAGFEEATFSKDADFGWATFTQNADFSRATFKGRTVFQHTVFPTTDMQGGVRFQEAAMEKPEEFSFEDVDLSRTSFLRANLAKVQFTDVTWAKKWERIVPWIKPWVTHSVLFDHLEMERKEHDRNERSSASAETTDGNNGAIAARRDNQKRESENRARLVANLYRQLRMNYEGQKQEVEAGHFYIGQMDMRRLDPETPWFMRRLALPLYRAIAMYSESAWRPLILYLLTSFVFAALYLYAGFYWGGEETHKAVDYAWRWGGFFLPFSGDFLKAEYLALSAGSLLRGNAQVIADWGLVVAYANMVWDIFLIALFVIALRRHFRR